MPRYAYVAVVQTVDPAKPQRWEITGDVVGPDLVSEDRALDCMISGGGGLAETTGISAEYLQVVVFSAFETAE